MKKYLGSTIDAFVAVVTILFIGVPLPFAIGSFSSGFDAARVIILVGCILCVIIWVAYLKEISVQLYGWGCFFDYGVQIKSLFKKTYLIEYAKCFSCGIGFYTHGYLNTQMGTRVYYIFLSYEKFDEKYRTRINLWRITKSQIKIKFSKELYDFLIAVLPKPQRQMLIEDYKKYKTEVDSRNTRGQF